MPSLSRNINVISRCASSYRADRLEGCGISSAHYFYVLAIYKNPGISQDKLAKKLYLNKSSVARALQVLESDGFISRKSSTEDRRITLVYPTKKAELIYPLIKEVSDSWNEFLLESLDENERDIFTELMKKVSERASSYMDKGSEGEK